MVRHQIVEPIPRHAARRHVVDQPRQIVGERQRRRRRAWRRAALPLAVDFGRVRPISATSRASSSRRSSPSSAGGRVERVGGDVAGRGLRERDLVLVDVADRRRCAAGSRRRLSSTSRNIRAPAGRRAASADRAWRRPARADRAAAAKPGTSVPSDQRLISVGRNGAEAGMVKTRGRGHWVMRGKHRRARS